MKTLSIHTTCVVALILSSTGPAAARQTSVGSVLHTPPAPIAERAVRASGPSPSNLTLVAQLLSDPPTGDVLLSGVEFLPMHVAGTTMVNRNDPNRPHLVSDVPDTSVIELPGPERVRLLHYRRSSGTMFGFLRLDNRGGMQLLVERLGLTASNTFDPFDTVIGVSEQGCIVISAPTFSGGVGGYGDCWLFPVTPLAPGIGPAVELTGPGQQDVAGCSLTFKGDWLYAVEEDTLARAPLDGSANLVQVTLPPSGGFPNPMVRDEMVLSADGSTLVLLAGVDEDNLDLYVIDASGTPRNLSNAPDTIQPPGYLPQEPKGPMLTLNEDGSLVAYVVEFPQGGELFLRSTAAVPSAPEHVTPDAIFDQSIDNVSGIFGSGFAFGFFADSGLDNADLYQATLGAGGGLSVINLTQTSGSSGPFYPNAAQIKVAASWQVNGLRMVVDDRVSEGAGYEFWITNDASSVLHVPGLSESPSTVSAGAGPNGTWLTTLRTSAATGLVYLDGASGLLGLPLFLPSTFRIEEVVARAAGNLAALSVRAPSGLEYLVLLDLLGGRLRLAGNLPYQDVANLIFTDEDQLLHVSGSGTGFTPHFVDLDHSVTVTVGPEEAVSCWLR